MGIEELEKELRDLKAYAYDINNEYAKLKERIDAVTEEIKKMKENGTSLENTEVTVINEEAEVPQETAVVTPVENSEEQVQETTEVIPQVNEVQETAVVTPTDNSEEQVQETTEVIPQANDLEESTVVTPVESSSEIQVDNAPLIKPIEVPGTQPLAQEPLTPSVVETSNIVENVVYNKMDSYDAKAISTSEKQIANLRASKEVQKGLALNQNEVAEQSGPVIEIPTGEKTGVTELNQTAPVVIESPEDLEKQMNDMMTELATTTDEVRANELNNKLAELNEKRKQLVIAA